MPFSQRTKAAIFEHCLELAILCGFLGLVVFMTLSMHSAWSPQVKAGDGGIIKRLGQTCVYVFVIFLGTLAVFSTMAITSSINVLATLYLIYWGQKPYAVRVWFACVCTFTFVYFLVLAIAGK
jgi:hypothetical protein